MRCLDEERERRGAGNRAAVAEVGVAAEVAMPDATYSFVFDLQSAHAAFRGIGSRELAMSLLAGMPPDPGWEGCRVELGESPLGPGTSCVVTRGTGAGELQLRLVEAFERQGVRVVQVYEGGPGGGDLLATAREGRWT